MRLTKAKANALQRKAIALWHGNPSMTCREIAEIVGVNATTIYRYVRHQPGYKKRSARKRSEFSD